MVVRPILWAALLLAACEGMTGDITGTTGGGGGGGGTQIMPPPDMPDASVPQGGGPQTPSAYDPKQRFLFAMADVDGNGTRDDITVDRVSGLFTVRLFGAFPSGHPYAAVDQAACTATVWANMYDASKTQPNVDYCNAVVRPEEAWATRPFADPMNDALRLYTGRFTDPSKDALLIWDQGTAAFTTTTTQPDTLGKRPGLTTRFAFNFSAVDLTSTGWENTGRPWENVLIGDINGDGLDDVVGLVNRDDTQAQSPLGLFALTSHSGQPHGVQLLATLDARFRTLPLVLGAPEQAGQPELLAVEAGAQKITAIALDGTARTLVTLGGTIPGTGALNIDEVSAAPLFGAAPSLFFRARRDSMPHAAFYAVRGQQLQAWKCPWKPDALDGAAANQACLAGDPVTDATARTATATAVLSPSDCGSSCRAALQAKLSDSSVRNVVLLSGSYALDDVLTVSSLDGNGNHTAGGKRLIGQGATLVGGNRYYTFDGTTVHDVVPASSDTAAETARFDKCRAYRDYDATGNYGTTLPAPVATVWYRYLRTECPVVQTLGSHVTVSGLTIDTTALSALYAAGVHQGIALPQFVSIDVGYYADGWALPYDSGGAKNMAERYRVIDTSYEPDEHVRVENVQLISTSAAGVQTEPAPMAVRDLLAEDVRCTRSDDLTNPSNCIEVDAAPMITWPFEASYRSWVAFSPPQTTNYTIRKGPNTDSICDLQGNWQTVRISGAVGFRLENCVVHKGLNDGIFLYVTDTGAKLDATLMGDVIDLNPQSNAHFAYDATLPPMENDALITVSGRGMSRNAPFNQRLDLPASDAQLAANRRADQNELYFDQAYVYASTPSQVMIDGCTSMVLASLTGADSDSENRVHVKELLGISGKLIIKDSKFFGGAKILSADLPELWGNTVSCVNAFVADWTGVSPDQKACTGAYVTTERALLAGRSEVLGYTSATTTMDLADPFVPRGNTHGSWFELINVSGSVSNAEAITVLPGTSSEIQVALRAALPDGQHVSVSTKAWPPADPPVTLPTLP
jgi:hypothetical protein